MREKNDRPITALLLDLKANEGTTRRKRLLVWGGSLEETPIAGKPRRPKSKDLRGEIITEKLFTMWMGRRRNQERCKLWPSPMSLAFLAFEERGFSSRHSCFDSTSDGFDHEKFTYNFSRQTFRLTMWKAS